MDEDRSLDEVRGAHAQTLGLCCLRGLSPLHQLRAGGFLTPRNARPGDGPAPPTPRTPQSEPAPRVPRALSPSPPGWVLMALLWKSEVPLQLFMVAARSCDRSNYHNHAP